ncbi:MAG: hypothetical protein D6743_19940 [Calditrichaeota bacterium]|nr:MAG: hypothetical protein D6743_19940 [Calditrichota bacterium]
MKKKDLQKILYKIEEIKALFVFGQRVVPYLEELVMFVQETTPLLEEVNSSILESSDKMPAAVKQLDKVSETTEMATTDILNRIDQILAHLEETLSLVDQIEKDDQERMQKERELILRLAETLDGEAETRAARVDEALKSYYDDVSRKSKFNRLRECFQELQGEAYEIMNLLQVQDITTQQIMAANSLIESVQSKLHKLMTQFGSLDVKEMENKNRAFDPNAVYENRSSVQAMADEILNTGSAENLPTVKQVSEKETAEIVKRVAAEDTSKASQEEIDRLFNELNSH